MPKITINEKEYITDKATMLDVARTEQLSGKPFNEILDGGVMGMATLSFWMIDKKYPNAFRSPSALLELMPLSADSLLSLRSFYDELISIPDFKDEEQEGEEKKGKAGTGKKPSSTPTEPELNLQNSGS